MNLGPSFEIRPTTALVDEEVAIRVLGLQPGARVTVRATTSDDLSRGWQSHAGYVADGDGVVDLIAHPSLGGTYDGIEPMGLFWSMMLDDSAGVQSPFVKGTPTPISVLLTVEADGLLARATVVRTFMSPGVTRSVLRDAGLSGTFFAPAGSDRRPGVIVLGGSEGGVLETRAAMLASHGFSALALAYFAYDGVPDELVKIPLEYFEAALKWMQEHPRVRPDQLGLLGVSRGGELSLLLATIFDQIRTVVAYVPSALVWGGVGANCKEPAWTWRGRAVPWISRDLDPDLPHGEPIRAKDLFLNAMEDQGAVQRSTIPVDRIKGPILLISADDDQMWPSSPVCEMIMQRLARFDHPYHRLHLSYEGAGHVIMFPYMPVVVGLMQRPRDSRILALGGSPEAQAGANADSWSRVLRFLQEVFP